MHLVIVLHVRGVNVSNRIPSEEGRGAPTSVLFAGVDDGFFLSLHPMVSIGGVVSVVAHPVAIIRTFADMRFVTAFGIGIMQVFENIPVACFVGENVVRSRTIIFHETEFRFHPIDPVV